MGVSYIAEARGQYVMSEKWYLGRGREEELLGEARRQTGEGVGGKYNAKRG